MTISKAAMRSEVESFVAEERRRLGIQRVDGSTKPEPSGEAFDEFENLLQRQLLTTTIGLGAWNSLEDEKILSGVHSVVDQIRRTARS